LNIARSIKAFFAPENILINFKNESVIDIHKNNKVEVETINTGKSDFSYNPENVFVDNIGTKYFFVNRNESTCFVPHILRKDNDIERTKNTLTPDVQDRVIKHKVAMKLAENPAISRMLFVGLIAIGFAIGFPMGGHFSGEEINTTNNEDNYYTNTPGNNETIIISFMGDNLWMMNTGIWNQAYNKIPI